MTYVFFFVKELLLSQRENKLFHIIFDDINTEIKADAEKYWLFLLKKIP